MQFYIQTFYQRMLCVFAFVIRQVVVYFFQKGLMGPDGMQGWPGEKGDAGLEGEQGTDISNVNGPPGDEGEPGLMGVKGQKGIVSDYIVCSERKDPPTHENEAGMSNI